MLMSFYSCLSYFHTLAGLWSCWKYLDCSRYIDKNCIHAHVSERPNTISSLSVVELASSALAIYCTHAALNLSRINPEQDMNLCAWWVPRAIQFTLDVRRDYRDRSRDNRGLRRKLLAIIVMITEELSFPTGGDRSFAVVAFILLFYFFFKFQHDRYHETAKETFKIDIPRVVADATFAKTSSIMYRRPFFMSLCGRTI